MPADSVVRARIDAETKKEAAAALAEMGLSVSDYIRMALVRVARDKAVPFAVKVPNAVTVKAMKEIDRGEGKRFDTVEEMFKDLGI
ncbi:type II toxin-antitoxin system RelB/DinJ family antitoxin [Aquibium sp. A9E412]|uniref:type II toxin-antitoxin system RelB/DinJ family antitoxin n=1 Tax=Aquibium sp. A9E412 TaxID=2976767 RepID=UPI0025B1C1FB|nr:type II toxin-antitoxin system RelB/DinJ family antitoxin [Aquibium sp. A9E412]MDN2565165.1 type II toxin-antitoxin system RelB/DinJ family antitoxin [Aquibium sp. A9E412]